MNVSDILCRRLIDYRKEMDMKKGICLLLALLLMLSLASCGSTPEEAATINTAEPTEPTEVSEIEDVEEHVYDHDCDEECNECGEIRVVADHTYENPCDGTCDNCGHQREVSEHEYDSDCDSRCNTCNTKRETVHGRSNDVVGYCTVCGEYTGQTGDVNFRSTLEFDDAQVMYFRVRITQGLAQSIVAEDADAFAYVAYIGVDGEYQEAPLGEEPQSLNAADYLYLVITPTGNAGEAVLMIQES